MPLYFPLKEFKYNLLPRAGDLNKLVYSPSVHIQITYHKLNLLLILSEVFFVFCFFFGVKLLVLVNLVYIVYFNLVFSFWCNGKRVNNRRVNENEASNPWITLFSLKISLNSLLHLFKLFKAQLTEYQNISGHAVYLADSCSQCLSKPHVKTIFMEKWHVEKRILGKPQCFWAPWGIKSALLI